MCRMRLIDADALIRHSARNIEDMSIGIEYIIFAPTIDVVPVIHDRVVVNWLGDCRCSGCHILNRRRINHVQILRGI